MREYDIITKKTGGLWSWAIRDLSTPGQPYLKVYEYGDFRRSTCITRWGAIREAKNWLAEQTYPLDQSTRTKHKLYRVRGEQ